MFKKMKKKNQVVIKIKLKTCLTSEQAKLL